MEFTDAETVTLFLNKEELTDEEESIVNMLVFTIGGVIRNHCGWEVLATDYVKKFDGNDLYTLDLHAYPLNSVTSITIDDVDYIDSVQINDEDGEVYFETSSGVTFSSGKRNVAVSYNAGFQTVPNDLKHAASWLVALYFNRITSENIGVKSEKFNQIDVEYDDTDIPVLVKRVLDRYRLVRIF